jgi:hypothetical protein
VTCNCLHLDNFEQGLEAAPLVGNHLDRTGNGTLGPFLVMMEVGCQSRSLALLRECRTW